jgi:multidrug efflux system outer membrane protein
MRLAAALAALLLSACTVGPDYERPPLELPEASGAAVPAAAPEGWWRLFADPVLDRLVAEALEANRDLRAAAARVDAARARYGVVRAEQFPAVGIQGSSSRDRFSESVGFPPPPDAIESTTHRLVVRASWELDFWGRYRRSSEAARGELAASEAGREAVRMTLVGDVVRGYHALRALDAALAVAVRTLEGRAKALELQKLRYDSGIVSELELRQVEADVRGAEALVPLLEQRRAREEGALALLLGRSPRAVFAASVERGGGALAAPPDVPAGLPSDLLLRRPDLREAEARLMAANARIGVARSAYFPAITLTGFYGGESQALADLFSSPARSWSVAAGLLQPVFGAGEIAAGVDLAEANTREAVALYEQAVARAFGEARDAIAAQGTSRRIALATREREAALGRALELSKVRYANGTVSLFEVLETERQLLAARLETLDADRDRRSAIVDLFLALGG